MANLPEGLAQFEYQKMQLIGSLGAVAETMRSCATFAEQFAQLVSHVPYNPPMHPNGQFAIPAMPPALPLQHGKRKAGDEVDGRKPKKPRKPKDPNAPKRPASSYLLFQNEVRQELKAKHPNLPNNELLGVIAKMWKDMAKDEKDAYEARQRLAKDQWLADKSAYQASKEEEAASEDIIVPVAAVNVTPILEGSAAPVISETSYSSSEDEDEDASSSSEASEGAHSKQVTAGSSNGTSSRKKTKKPKA